MAQDVMFPETHATVVWTLKTVMAVRQLLPTNNDLDGRASGDHARGVSRDIV